MLQYDLSDLLGMDSTPTPPPVDAPKEASQEPPAPNSLFAFMQLQDPIQPSDPLNQFKPEQPSPADTLLSSFKEIPKTGPISEADNIS